MASRFGGAISISFYDNRLINPTSHLLPNIAPLFVNTFLMQLDLPITSLILTHSWTHNVLAFCQRLFAFTKLMLSQPSIAFLRSWHSTIYPSQAYCPLSSAINLHFLSEDK